MADYIYGGSWRAIKTWASNLFSTKAELETGLQGKAERSHTHGISQVDGLQGSLDGKALKEHDHAIADTTGLQGALDGKAPASHNHNSLYYTKIEVDNKIANIEGVGDFDTRYAAADHTHSEYALKTDLSNVMALTGKSYEYGGA